MSTISTTLLLLLTLIASCARCYAQESERIRKFRTLSGPDQVRMLLHGTSLFRRIFTVDFEDEERLLAISADPTIDGALALEARQGNTGRAREAILVICERARFIPYSEFLIPQVFSGFASYGRDGTMSPFAPDLDRVGKEAAEAVRAAIGSSNAELRATAKLYSGELERELASVPAGELARRWRLEIGRLPAPIYYDSDSTERGELVRVLQRALASKGLEAAIAISSMLEKESKAWAREREVEMIDFLDSAAIRLRASPQGRDVIRVMKNALDTQSMSPALTQKEDRQQSWQYSEARFFKDDVMCSLDSWASFIARALDHIYGDQLTVQRIYEGRSLGKICIDDTMSKFISYLTEKDPTFPAWEFPSTASWEDMFHPRFPAKIARYHQAWKEFVEAHPSSTAPLQAKD
jgi:hypothetical protein